MSGWSDPGWIKEQVLKKWNSGRILRSLLIPDDLFPLTIPLKKPSAGDIGESFAKVSDWARKLRENSKEKTGFGYDLIEKEIVHRQTGRNLLPSHVIVPTENDALLLLKKKKEADEFIRLTRIIKTGNADLPGWPVLQDWIYRYPFKVIDYTADWEKILSVLNWFHHHPKSSLYTRQLDIPTVDTKFIEQRKGVLTELLNIILPPESIDNTADSFEHRYGLRQKPVRIRMRFLDAKLFVSGLSDITIPVDQMVTYKSAVSRVFITENEINGLCFPNMPDSMVIFGLGYGVDILSKIGWLRDCDVYYWGDIDTHGFAMLDQTRSFLPLTKSILMNEEVLLLYRDLWSTEEKPFSGRLSRLCESEQRLFSSLQSNKWGKGVRLEQERISFRHVLKELALLK